MVCVGVGAAGVAGQLGRERRRAAPAAARRRRPARAPVPAALRQRDLRRRRRV